jgi:ATPase, AAA_4 family
MENLEILIDELVKYPNETPWLEFKHNNYDPETIGEDISALANGATLEEKSFAYFLWGVDDETHELVGTEHDLQNIKKGNEELENWLRGNLSRNVDFEYQKVQKGNVTIGILIIKSAIAQPVTFRKIEYIRVGSYTKKMMEYPALQSRLWNRLHNIDFETQSALQNLDLQVALQLLEYNSYFDLTGIPLPVSADGIVHYMLQEGILIKQDNGQYAISNLGAILFAKRLSDFQRVSRKAIRVVQYQGTNRMSMLKEEVIEKGYVVGFEGMIKFIGALIPTQEIIVEAIREKKSAYPILAIRETVANALIHQDFSVSGTGPTVEVFANRIEITNSGIPLIDVKRIIDNPPKSRNEKLASIMRRLRMCEELGTGWDKIVISCEMLQLPAPKIELFEESTKVTLFSEMPFNSIAPEDKLWACYLHACILHVQGEQLTNSSLRERFGLKQSSSGSVSRLIKEAVEQKLIKPLDPDTAPRYMKYIPIWV